MQNVNIKNLFSIFKHQVKSGKAQSILKLNKYTFLIDQKVNKFTIKLIIEYFFHVTVQKINLLAIKGKQKKIKRFLGYKSQYKKAIISIKIGDNINLF